MSIYTFLFVIQFFIISMVITIAGEVMASTRSEHDKVSNEIQYIYTDDAKREVTIKKLDDEINALEKQLSDIEKERYSTENKIEQRNQILLASEKEFKVLEHRFNLHKKALAQQLQALYTAGEQSHLRLLLRQDDPSDISRTIKYFEYLNHSRLNKIQTLKELMEKLEKAKINIAQEQEKLRILRFNLGKQKKKIDAILKVRNNALEKSKQKLANNKVRLSILKKREKRLKSKLNRLMEKQRQKRKRKKIATKKQEKKSKKKHNSKKKPAKLRQRSGALVGRQRFVPDKPFSALKGRLSWPVRGRIVAKYGTRRNEKQRWKGVLIAAKGGSRVHAIAKGKVEFSGWFKGFGYLIILRHDNSYRSLYGYNRAVHVREGQIVKAGSVIASVGNSGGQQHNGLYFEVRRGMRPQNPKKWCK